MNITVCISCIKNVCNKTVIKHYFLSFELILKSQFFSTNYRVSNSLKRLVGEEATSKVGPYFYPM